MGRWGQFDGILKAAGEQKNPPQKRGLEKLTSQGTGPDDMGSGLYFLPLQAWRLLRTVSAQGKSRLALP